LPPRWKLFGVSNPDDGDFNVDEFVRDIRGEIVHRGTTPGPLHKGGVESWINVFDGLVSRLDNKIGTQARDDSAGQADQYQRHATTSR
jgi:hypothetical protein